MVYSATLFNTDPYWDDFNEDKKFLRMVFKPGRAVQARELTQLQTIIQDQVKKFGDHVFQNGSRVLGGEISNQDAVFLRVYTTDQTSGSDLNVNGLIGTDITLQSPADGDTRRAKCLYGTSGGTSDRDNYYMLFCQYMDGGGVYGEQFGENDTIKGVCGDNTYVAKIAVSGDLPDRVSPGDATNVDGVTGTAKLTTVNNGIFFINGHFVKSDTQSTSPYGLTGAMYGDTRWFYTPTSRVGFDIEKSIVEHTDDYTLRDPASGSFNYNAPGADRYKINLSLAFKNFVNDASYGASGFGDANFVDLVRFVDGNVEIKKSHSQYSEIEKTLARRTYDESGSYTTKPFEIDIRESLSTLGGPYSDAQGGSEDVLAIGLQPGKAYVFGYEYETQTPQYVLMDKARTDDHVATVSGQPVNNVTFGQYALVRAGAGATQGLVGGFDSGITSDTYPTILLADAGSNTGEAKVREIVPTNDLGSESMTGPLQPYKMYLFDINLQGITAFGNVVKFGETTIGAGSLTASFEVSSGGSSSTGGTILFSPSFNTSVFPLPIGNSVKDVSSLTYRTHRTFTFDITDEGVPYNTGSPNASLTFVGTTDNNNPPRMSAADKQTYYTLICTSGGHDQHGTTGMRVDTNKVTIEKSSIGGITIGNDGWDTGKQLYPGSYTLSTTLDVANSGTNPLRKTKTMTLDATTDFDNGDGDGESGLSGSNGNWYIPLGHRDIIDVTRVQDTHPQTRIADAVGLPSTDVKDAFILDNGQRDNYYGYGRIYLNPSTYAGTYGVTGPLSATVTYNYLDHSGDGPFVVDSYTHSTSGFTYDNIPIYTSTKTGKSFSLRNCIDFRGTEQAGTEVKVDGLNPRSGEAVNTSYEHYLSRIDKIILTKERKFDIISGIPSINPSTPPDRADAMTLYVLTVPSYTFNIDDVTSKYVENKRYTMRDIGSIEKRVENLEYYTSLSLLEQQTEARSFLDSDGNDIFKNGIMVDAFRGHSVGDVVNGDYTCSIDYENGHLRPPFTSGALELHVDSSSNMSISSDGVATLSYTPYGQFVWQPFASETIQVNPFNIPSFMGYIKFYDPFDGWYDQTNKPTVKINTQGENDRWKINNGNFGYGFGSQWNDWETLWSGRTVTTSDIYGNRGRDYLSTYNTTSLPSNIENRTRIAESSAIRSTETLKNNEGRSGIRIRKLPERLEKLVNDRLVDVSVVPYINDQTIVFNAHGLKPNVSLYPFFDGKNVSTFCGVCGGASGGGITSGVTGSVVNHFFSIPGATHANGGFKTGEKLFRLTDNASDTVAETATAADGVYYAQGIVQQRDGILTSTRPIISRRQVVNDNAIVRDAFDREQYINTSSNNLWLDPLSQTFIVNNNTYENGAFLDSVDLFFYEKDNTVPITLEVRPTINGYPHLSQVMPLSTVTLIPDDSEIRTDFPLDETYTRFTFSTPLHLTPGEYCFSLRTSSDKYKLYSATIGANDLNGGSLVSQQPGTGVLFYPENTGISIPASNRSLKFRINNCQFDTSGSISIGLTGDGLPTVATPLVIDTFKIASGEHTPTDSGISYTFAMPNITTTSIITNENIYLESPQTLNGYSLTDFVLTGNVETSDVWVSPVIDTKRLDLITVNNVINTSSNTSTNGELDANAHSSDPLLYENDENLTEGAAARYITRRVTLADGFESKNFKVLLSANKPAEGSIQVFIKAISEENDTPFEDVGYTLMSADSTVPDSANNYDFYDITYSLSSSFDLPIKTFAIKICLYSNSSTKVPMVKDFRAIALAE